MSQVESSSSDRPAGHFAGGASSFPEVTVRRTPADKPQLRIAPAVAGGPLDHAAEQAAADEREADAVTRFMRAIFGERFTLDPVRLGRAKRRRK